MVHIIKIYFENSKKGQEIRRLTVSSDVVSNFNQLLEKIQNVYQLSNAENLDVKWRDPENDFILMSSNDELAQALANAEDGILRLYVSLRDDISDGTNIPKSNASKDFHPFVVCDGCDKKIVGVRYKCLQCRNYDLCSSCDAADKHPIHDMIKFVKPTYIPREWVFVGARKLWKSMFSRCSSYYFPFSFNENEQSPDAENFPNVGNAFCQDPLNANIQANCNTVPKSAASNSADNAPKSSTSQQEQEPSPPNAHSASHTPLPDLTKLPKLIHEGLSQVLKAVHGTIEVVDHNIYKPEFRRGQENTKKAASGTGNAPTKAAPNVEELRSTISSILVPEGIRPVPNENINNILDKYKSSASAANENEDEIIIDLDNDKSAKSVQEPTACPEGWTLLDGDASRMECNEATATRTECNEAATTRMECNEADVTRMECNEGNATRMEHNEGNATRMECNNANPTETVVYPDLREVQASQERSSNYIYSSDPMIISAVEAMQAMGFTNEGGWLERLVISKQGNINDALEALYPSNH